MVTLIRAPACVSFGTVCCHSCWQRPPMTTRSPSPVRSVRVAGPWSPRPQQEPPPLAQPDGHHDRRRHPLAHRVAVPGDPVATVPVEVDQDRVEVDAVPLGHRRADLGELGRQGGEVLARPGCDQPGLEHLALVHPSLALLPGRLALQPLEQLGVARVPARGPRPPTTVRRGGSAGCPRTGRRDCPARPVAQPCMQAMSAVRLPRSRPSRRPPRPRPAGSSGRTGSPRPRTAPAGRRSR